MDHVRLDAVALQPTPEPEAVAARFVGNSDTGDGTSPLHGFISPAPKEAEEIFGVGLHLLLRLPLDARDQTGNQPTLLTEARPPLPKCYPYQRRRGIDSYRLHGLSWGILHQL
jgi:hypothetical protein